jgi:hypothetical protein
MSSNFFMAAALSGLGAGLGGYARAQQSEQDAALRAANERALLEARLAAQAPRSGSGGGGSGGGSAAAPFSREEFDKKLEALTGMQPGELARVRDGSLWDKAGEITVDDEGNPLAEPIKTKERAMGWEELRAKKLAEIKPYAEGLIFGKDYDQVAKGMGERQHQGLVDKYAGGDDRSGRAALLAKGKDLYEGNSDVTRDVVTGKTEATEVGKASAGKKAAEARKADDQGDAALIKANKPTGTGGKGGKSTDPATIDLRRLNEERVRLNQQVNALQKAMDGGTKTIEVGGVQVPIKQAHNAALSRLAALDGQIKQAGSPGAAPAPAASGFKIINVRPK